MRLSSLNEIEFATIEWDSYDLVLLASGFEDRSRFIFERIPEAFAPPCVVFGFCEDMEKLSRPINDSVYLARGFNPIVENGDALDNILLEQLSVTISRKAKGQRVRIFVDYSAMTRSWYAFILTWLRYIDHLSLIEVDFAYVHGTYHGDFEPLHIRDISAIPGFEGTCAGTRRTVAIFGLGFDRYASLAVYEQIEPDAVVCFVAQDSVQDPASERVLRENKEILAISGCAPVRMPLGNIPECVRLLREQVSQIGAEYEVILVPMGPKPHVLAGLIVAQLVPQVTCLHARGYRKSPVQVTANGRVNIWRLSFNPGSNT